MLFLIISIVVFIAVTTLAPKKLPKRELYAIALFSIVLGFIVDIILDLKYHLYGYFDHGVQFTGLLPILFLFPTSGLLFMNFYPFQKPKRRQLLYILGWTVFSLIFEYFSILSGYFYHNGWKFWYSAVTYPFLFLIHLLQLKIFRRYIDKQ